MAEWMGQELLRAGSKGQSVAELQKRLTDLGYDVGGIDADFGEKTEAALRQFQKDAGIGIDAIAGQQTYSALQNAPSKPKIAAPAAPAPGAPSPGPSGSSPPAQQAPASTPPSPPATSPSAPDSVNQFTSALGERTSLEDILSGFREAGKTAGMPFESALDDLIANMPRSPGMSGRDIRKAAERYAGLIIDPQELALQQYLEQLNASAASGRENIEAAYAGAEQSTGRLLADSEARARRDAVRRKGSRAGLLEYLMGEYGQPITEQFAQTQAQRAASLSDLERNLMMGQQQTGQRMEALGAQRGALQAQQEQALQDLMYSQQTGDWSRALGATQALMGAATQSNQFAQNLALSLLPYTELTESERQMFPLLWSQTMYQTPQSTADLLRQLTGGR